MTILNSGWTNLQMFVGLFRCPSTFWDMYERYKKM